MEKGLSTLFNNVSKKTKWSATNVIDDMFGRSVNQSIFFFVTLELERKSETCEFFCP